MKKAKVLAFVDYYLPGYKGGGPAVSVSRLVNNLKDEFGFLVFTRDRDLGEMEAYPHILPGSWVHQDSVEIYYAKPQDLSILGLCDVIRQTNPDVIYLNSYFSRLTWGVLTLRLMRLIQNVPILIAPRGEFSPGALQIKALKKKLYLKISKLIRLHYGVTWQVSSARELCDTYLITGAKGNFVIKAPDIVAHVPAQPTTVRPQKVSGSANFVFISRISPKKNLLKAIEMLAEVKGEVTFTIYGPIEDRAYWAKCESAISALPPNIHCISSGGISPDEVVNKLAEHHFFLFPTLGENFGHVIPEALMAGCPVLVSDQTPWQDFEDCGVGWVTELDELEKWRGAIQACIDMDFDNFEAMSARSQQYILNKVRSSCDIEKNRELFDLTIQNHAKRAA